MVRFPYWFNLTHRRIEWKFWDRVRLCLLERFQYALWCFRVAFCCRYPRHCFNLPIFYHPAFPQVYQSHSSSHHHPNNTPHPNQNSHTRSDRWHRRTTRRSRYHAACQRRGLEGRRRPRRRRHDVIGISRKSGESAWCRWQNRAQGYAKGG
ncbi:hypothetical protein K458DRAFT_142055 [Lentithecium fluviatile CBS 122367]|uniref:Uncharacterized protein n=1 Tax=Lentithecium fluviatile CBS 122367 TaxID=1168545 RepID=A0A6G1IJV6_9PLEO|nr:hypothetical protein K458DRAFT_142055 [Lentithecium fluviatile CBS 122367]